MTAVDYKTNLQKLKTIWIPHYISIYNQILKLTVKQCCNDIRIMYNLHDQQS